MARDPAAEPENVLSRIGYLSEDRDLPQWMKIQHLMAYRSAFYPDWDDGYAAELVEAFDLNVKQRVRTLSRGQLARTGLLLAIAHRPDLLLLDEPSSGLDPAVRRDILAAIIRTATDEGRTVLFSSHLLGEVQRVSDHVAMLHRGRVMLCDSLESVLTQHSRCVFRLPQNIPRQDAIPGTIASELNGSEYRVLCNGQRQQLDEWLTANDAEILDESHASLEEIFLARSSVCAA